MTPAARYGATMLADGPTTPPPGVSWDAVVDVARAGRVEALVLRAIRSSAPKAVCDQLEPRAKKVAFSALRALGERDRVLVAMNDAAVDPVVLLTGAVVAWLTYPDPLLRSTNDLDILVRRDQAAPAHGAMLAAGYTEVDLFGAREASAAAYHERLYGRELVAGRVRQPVEVHTGFAQHFRHDIDYDAVIARALPFPEGGPHAYRLDNADQLIHLAVHLAREQFLSPFKHLLDVHLWVERGGIDWSAVISRSLAWGAATSVAETLRLSTMVFGTQVPSEAQIALAPGGLRGRWLRWWHAPSSTGMTRRPVSMRFAQALALMPLLDTTAQRARFVAQYARLRLKDVT